MGESEDLDHSAQPSASCGTDGERGGESGVRSPKKVQDPRVPTRAEVDEHNMTHLPYRSWCTHCVRGRGEAHPHHNSGDEERDVPELHVDHCFMGKVDEKAQPIVVVKERDTRMMCSVLVGEKGVADEHVIKRIIEELGYESTKIVLKSDQESSVNSVIDTVIRARRDTPTMPEYSPVRSSGSNGVIERRIKEVQGQLRAMKSALDTRVGVDIRGTSNILPWMVEYASVLINRYLVGKDGKTAYERFHGKKSVRASIFGGFPCKADAESSTASGRRDSSLDIGRKVASTRWPTARELLSRGR